MQDSSFFCDMCISEFNFVQTYIADASDYPMHNRGRRHHGFLCTVSGTETYHFRDSKIAAVPGSVLYIPKGEVYDITLSDEQSVVITIDFELSSPPSRPFLIKFSESNSIKRYFSKAEAEWNKKDSPYQLECKSLLYKIAGQMAKQTSLFLPSGKYDKIKGAVEYLHSHYLENDFRLDDVCKAAGIGYRYFETLFFQKYGMTPKEYVISLKIERAKELLSSEKLLIKDIAIMLGYSDIYHFGKIFTAKTGCTPSKYRENIH